MLWSAYLRQLHHRPLRVKACTSCCTFCLTDAMAQHRERSAALAARGSTSGGAIAPVVYRYDPLRTARNGLFGLLWLGPTNHIVWGKTAFGLEHWFPGSSWRAVFSRVAVDQVTNMPMNMVVFLAWPALLTGQGIAAAARDVREAFWPSFTFAISVWPFVHPLSFRYVPLEHRLLVLNVCSVFVFSYATWASERANGLQSRLRRTPTDERQR